MYIGVVCTLCGMLHYCMHAVWHAALLHACCVACYTIACTLCGMLHYCMHAVGHAALLPACCVACCTIACTLCGMPLQEGPMIHSGAICASTLARAEFKCGKKVWRPKVSLQPKVVCGLK